MSSPDMLLDVLRAELRAAGITYKMLADRIAMSESSIKRMFGQKDMTLSRLADLGQALVIDAAYVNVRLDALAVNEDLSRYVL
jgi:DNA-binding Xre family transcriptional regulator